MRAKLEEMLDEAKDRMEISRENMDRLKAALVRLDEIQAVCGRLFCG